jgi:hypothetical protein
MVLILDRANFCCCLNCFKIYNCSISGLCDPKIILTLSLPIFRNTWFFCFWNLLWRRAWIFKFLRIDYEFQVFKKRWTAQRFFKVAGCKVWKQLSAELWQLPKQMIEHPTFQKSDLQGYQSQKKSNEMSPDSLSRSRGHFQRVMVSRFKRVLCFIIGGNQ